MLDRIQLCAQHGHGGNTDTTPNAWFGFSKCIWRNWEATDTIDDKLKSFDATVEYCAGLSGQDTKSLKTCAETSVGLDLLEKSHQVDLKLNTHHDDQGNHLPVWLIIDGVDYSSKTSDVWLELICNTYKGTKPASCPK